MTIYSLPDPAHFESNIAEKNTHLFILQNRTGMQIALTDYGARLVSALVPDKHGELVDVVLGFDTIDKYVAAKEQYHGATIGRVANRIAHGKFTLEGTDFTLAQNNGSNALHGGAQGFHTKVWDRQVSLQKKVDFYYISPDGEEGFPGEVRVNVSYELTNENEIVITFRANTDKSTLLNLTNHAYFNLNGEGNGTIRNHTVQINASEYLPITMDQIPTGEKAPVKGTVFDFNKAKTIADEIDKQEEQLGYASGYDHSFVNTNPIEKIAASVFCEATGIQLEVYSDLPTVHLYTGNFLADDLSKTGIPYEKHAGLCIEAQHYIDSPNQPAFPTIQLNPGEEYQATIIYKFNIIK